MATKSTEIHAGIGSDAVKAKTNKGWVEWFALLDRAGASEWPHKKIAAYLGEQHGCPPWWSQMIAVGYEQARGLRVRHQTADGFTASASKTVNVSVANLFAAWMNPHTRAKWLGTKSTISIGKSTKNKRLRIHGSNGQPSIEVDFYAKGPVKSQVAIEQRKLSSVSEVNRTKAYWSAALSKLEQLLARPATRTAKSPRRSRSKTASFGAKKLSRRRSK